MNLMQIVKATGKGFWFSNGRVFGFQCGSVSDRLDDPYASDKDLLRGFPDYWDYRDVDKEVIDEVINRISFNIDSGVFSRDLARFMEKRLRANQRVRMILGDFPNAIDADGNYNGDEEFKYSVVAIYQGIINRVGSRKGVGFLVDALGIDFAYPGKLLQKQRRTQEEWITPSAEDGWTREHTKEQLCDVEYEDLVYSARYPLGEASARSLEFIRTNNDDDIGLYQRISSAILEFHRKTSDRKFSATRRLSEHYKT